MKLERIEITGLWHEQDIVWKLNSDVNILVGGNGAGKTTVLDLVCTVIPPLSMRQFLSQKADKIKLILKMIMLLNVLILKTHLFLLKKKQQQTHPIKLCLKRSQMTLVREKNTFRFCYLCQFHTVLS